MDIALVKIHIALYELLLSFSLLPLPYKIQL
jgi:hypothetical protein